MIGTRSDRTALECVQRAADELPPRYFLLGGRMGLPDRRLYLRTAAGAVVWLRVLPLLMWLVARRGRGAWRHTLERCWARSLARYLGLRLEVEGIEHVRPGEAYVVVPLHEGLADALALLHLTGIRLRFAVRDELFGWPLLGPYLRASRQIEVSPERGLRSYRHLLRQSRAVFAAGESVVVFPQGTILGIEADFTLGAFALARATGRPVLPVALTGGHRVWEHPYTPRLRYGQYLSVQVLESVMVPPDCSTAELERVRADVQARLKAAALSGHMAPPRRYVPARDGYWDGYAYRIDPAFPDLAADVARHRGWQAKQCR